jgi:glucosyl-3-phosphoglycerate synthase
METATILLPFKEKRVPITYCEDIGGKMWRTKSQTLFNKAESISVCIPAKNEEATVGVVVSSIKGFLETTSINHEILVFDHDSIDETRRNAESAGATVYSASSIIADEGKAIGKGDVLWRSVFKSTKDIIVWIDADLENFDPSNVLTLARPIMDNETVALVKADYERIYKGVKGEGGRVTQLTATPALKLLFPQLSHIRQPLGGEYAIRREVALHLPFEVDYGVEIGLLIDTCENYGVESIVQVELPPRIHRNQPLENLHHQATQVLRTVLERKGYLISMHTIRPAILAMPVDYEFMEEEIYIPEFSIKALGLSG